MSKALMIIDVQNDYFPGGKKELVNSEYAAKKAAELLNHARKSGMKVIHVKHISEYPGATFFLPGTEGSEIHESVKPLDGEKIVVKNFPNSFRSTDLDCYLHTNGIKEIVFCGMMSHMCVDSGVRAAKDYGYDCTLVHDACATCDQVFAGEKIPAEAVHRSFMAALNGAFAKIISADEFMNSF